VSAWNWSLGLTFTVAQLVGAARKQGFNVVSAAVQVQISDFNCLRAWSAKALFERNVLCFDVRVSRIRVAAARARKPGIG
jgi:hypothetical protein